MSDEKVELEEPEMYSEEWNDYVLSFLNENEMVEGRPRADGLVRVCGLLYGDAAVEWEEPKVHHVGPDYAAVTVVGKLHNVRHFGSAECTEYNTDKPYSKYPLATAETRAIGRVMKRMLGLTNILTAEESSEAARLEQINTSVDRTEGGITETQIKFIDRLCKKLNVDVKKVVTHVTGDHDSINELSHSEALMVNQVIDGWSKEEEGVYSEHGPYQENWRTDFVNEV